MGVLKTTSQWTVLLRYQIYNYALTVDKEKYYNDLSLKNCYIWNYVIWRVLKVTLKTDNDNHTSFICKHTEYCTYVVEKMGSGSVDSVDHWACWGGDWSLKG